MSVMDAVLIGLAMVLVIEGLAYALVPEVAKRMAMLVGKAPSDSLRIGGVIALGVGVGLVWVLLTH